MKAKTKRRFVHILTKKKLVKSRVSKPVLRSFLIALATISMGGLAYGILMNKPVVTVAVHSSPAGGIRIEAPIVLRPTPPVTSASEPAAMSGRGSWYALGLPQPDALTCASRAFPRGTHILVKNLNNSRTVICRVNDYGPEAWTGRIIDLSRGSFSSLDSLGRGTIPVELRIVAGATGAVSPTEGAPAVLIGYNLCRTSQTPQYCDSHRQD